MKIFFESAIWSLIKFIYFEKATKFCEISNVNWPENTYMGQIYGGDFAKFFLPSQRNCKVIKQEPKKSSDHNI